MQAITQKIFWPSFIVIAAYTILLSYLYFTQDGRLAFANNQLLASLLLIAGALFYPTAIKLNLNKGLKIVTYILLGFFILEFILKFYFWAKILLILDDGIFTQNFVSVLVYLTLAILMFLVIRINKFIEQ